MKKLLILIVAAALFLHFYPQPKLEAWYTEQKAVVIDIFSEAADTKVRLKADKVYSDLESQLNSFSSEERDFVKELTNNRKSIENFFNDYCQGKQPSPFLHPRNQEKVCHTIAQYSAMF